MLLDCSKASAYTDPLPEAAEEYKDVLELSRAIYAATIIDPQTQEKGTYTGLEDNISRSVHRPIF
jgi:hypothetical protein